MPALTRLLYYVATALAIQTSKMITEGSMFSVQFTIVYKIPLFSNKVGILKYLTTLMDDDTNKQCQNYPKKVQFTDLHNFVCLFHFKGVNCLLSFALRKVVQIEIPFA